LGLTSAKKKSCDSKPDTLKVSAKKSIKWESFNGDVCIGT
jgi:hypothetical protein